MVCMSEQMMMTKCNTSFSRVGIPGLGLLVSLAIRPEHSIVTCADNDSNSTASHAMSALQADATSLEVVVVCGVDTARQR